MSKKPTVTTVASGYYGRVALNDNFEALRDAFDNTLSRDGSTPNAMGADLDMNSNDILNAQTVSTESLKINGTLVGVGDLSAAGATLSSISHTGDGSTVAFSTGYQAFITDNTQVYIDGVYQNKTGYSISGTTLTFSEAPPLNAAIEIVVARTLDFGADDAANVNYNQGGTGAVNRTVLTKLQETVSVKDFGAVGDGVTDDTAAIQAAFNTGSLLYFPAGEYRVTTSISVTGDVRAYSDQGAEIFFDGSYSEYLIKFSNHNYLELTGLFFKGLNKVRNIVQVEQDTAADIAGSTIGSARAFVRDCKFTYAYQNDDAGSASALRFYGNYQTLTLDNLYIYGVSANEPTVTAPVLRGILISSIAEPASAARTRNPKNVKITNCHIEDVVASEDSDSLVIVSDTGNYIYGNVLISNNTFKTYGKRAIKCQIYSGAISNNFFERTATGSGTGVSDISAQLGGFVIDGNRFEYALNSYTPNDGVVKLAGDVIGSSPLVWHLNPSVVSNNVVVVIDDQSATPSSGAAPFWVTNKYVKSGALIANNTVTGRWDALVTCYLDGTASTTDYPLEDFHIAGNNIQYANSLLSVNRSGGVYGYINKVFFSNNNISEQSSVEAIEYKTTNLAVKDITASSNLGCIFTTCADAPSTVNSITGGFRGRANDLVTGNVVSIYRATDTGTLLTVGRRATDGTVTRALDVTSTATTGSVDNVSSLGTASIKWTEVFATNGTINTSDARQKTFLTIEDAETAAALEIKANLRKFKFNFAIEQKGESQARIHFGASAQQIGEILTSHGLDPDLYGFYCYDEWDAEYDDEGNEVLASGNSYGVRYEELLSFILAAI